MRLLLLMDIDGTLTPPRQPIEREMADSLARLAVPFHVAAGSDLVLVKPQFLEPLWEFGLRRDFDAFLANGAVHYRCPFSREFNIEEVYRFDFRHALGETAYLSLVSLLEDTLSQPGNQLPAELETQDPRIIYRHSMINFCPMGRPPRELTEEDRRRRVLFREFDEENGYRRRILAYLRRRLPGLDTAEEVYVTLGGETSFDIMIEGRDKTYAVRSLLKSGADKVIFLGDALSEGGNDFVITRLISNWPAGERCPLEAIQVRDWRETLDLLDNTEWLRR